MKRRNVSGRVRPAARRSAAPRRAAVAAERRLSVAGARSLRAGLARAVGAVLAYARSMGEAAEDPVRAVHEQRKAIRRARAVLGLLRPIVGDEPLEAPRATLRAALRRTSRLRDAAVLRQTVRVLRRVDGLGEALRRLGALVDARVRAARVRPRVRAALRAAARAAGPAQAGLARALPRRVTARDLEQALARSYRRARRARRAARDGGGYPDVHEWRKRVKELRYQLELLRTAGVPGAGRRERELDRLAEELGAVTDLGVLEAFVRAHAPRLRGHVPRLTAAMERRMRRGVERALSRSERFFAPRPGEFAERTLRAGRHGGSGAGRR